jgi:hypothetical protein
LLRGSSGDHVTRSSPAVFEGLRAGSYQVFVRSRVGTAVSDLKLTPGEQKTVALRLEAKGHTLRGRVIDAQTKAPVPKAVLLVRMQLNEGPAHLAIALTDTQGRFSVDQVPDGRVILGISSDHHARRFFPVTFNGRHIVLGDLPLIRGPEASTGPLDLGMVLWRDGNRARVKLLGAESVAAKSGLREGDEILQVGGIPTDGLDFAELGSLLAGPATPLGLTVARPPAKERWVVELPRAAANAAPVASP